MAHCRASLCKMACSGIETPPLAGAQSKVSPSRLSIAAGHDCSVVVSPSLKWHTSCTVIPQVLSPWTWGGFKRRTLSWTAPMTGNTTERTITEIHLRDDTQPSDFRVPPPATEEAITNGCTCPPQPERPTIAVACDCPLHQTDSGGGSNRSSRSYEGRKTSRQTQPSVSKSGSLARLRKR
jgi:hypothetical protein